MTPTLTLLNNDTIVVSPSQLEVIRTCPSMWRWKHLARRVKAQPNAASHGGKAFDEALNLRYKRHGAGACAPETESEMLALIDKAYEGVELPLDEHRTPARFKEAIQGYNAHWQAEPFEVLGVQVPFAVELGSVYVSNEFWHKVLGELTPLAYDACEDHRRVRVVVRGLLDLYVRLGQHVLIPDTKTSNNDIGGSYDNSAQLKCYCWALQELARLHPDAGLPPVVHGAFINGVIIRPPYKNENRKPGAKDKPRLEFTRTFPTFYTAERLERWRRDTLLWVEQALGWVARDHFPQNERHCCFYIDSAFKNYGTYGQQCPYLGICSLPPEQQLVALESDEFMDYERGPLGVPTEAAETSEINP
jgi:hypothetical protein